MSRSHITKNQSISATAIGLIFVFGGQHLSAFPYAESHPLTTEHVHGSEDGSICPNCPSRGVIHICSYCAPTRDNIFYSTYHEQRGWVVYIGNGKGIIKSSITDTVGMITAWDPPMFAAAPEELKIIDLFPAAVRDALACVVAAFSDK